jgi:fatty acid synthase subunit alpha
MHTVKQWKEFDNTVFKLSRDKWTLWLAKCRAEVITKLNADFAKPWFGWPGWLQRIWVT